MSYTVVEIFSAKLRRRWFKELEQQITHSLIFILVACYFIISGSPPRRHKLVMDIMLFYKQRHIQNI